MGENMFLKSLIIATIATLSLNATAALKANSDRNVTSSTVTVCQMNAGDTGRLKYRGQSYEKAFEKVTDDCFQKRNNEFIQTRGEQPDQDRQILFIESCVNEIKCV